MWYKRIAMNMIRGLAKKKSYEKMTELGILILEKGGGGGGGGVQ